MSFEDSACCMFYLPTLKTGSLHIQFWRSQAHANWCNQSCRVGKELKCFLHPTLRPAFLSLVLCRLDLEKAQLLQLRSSPVLLMWSFPESQCWCFSERTTQDSLCLKPWKVILFLFFYFFWPGYNRVGIIFWEKRNTFRPNKKNLRAIEKRKDIGIAENFKYN